MTSIYLLRERHNGAITQATQAFGDYLSARYAAQELMAARALSPEEARIVLEALGIPARGQQRTAEIRDGYSVEIERTA